MMPTMVDKVVPPQRHPHRSAHWLLRPRRFWPQWWLAEWDDATQAWHWGRQRLSAEDAARVGWRYSSPAVSAAALYPDRGGTHVADARSAARAADVRATPRVTELCPAYGRPAM